MDALLIAQAATGGAGFVLGLIVLGFLLLGPSDS